jgi:TPR repeat protein
MRLPDPARSRAVLIGVSEFADQNLPDLPSVRNNLTALATVLTSQWSIGLARERCEVVLNPPDVASVGARLDAAAQQAEDLLLVYYAGHGLLDSRGELYLSLPGTRSDNPQWAGLGCNRIREVIADSAADNRVLILDCCFSGRAVEAMADPQSVVSGQIEISGTYTLASTSSNMPAHAPEGAHHTVFTGALLDVLRGGVPDAQELLSLGAIYRQLLRSLSAKGRPRPQQRSTLTTDTLALAHNRWGAEPISLDEGPAAPDVEALVERAWALYKQDDLAGAEESYLAAAEAGSSDGINGLGAVFLRQGGTGKAEEWLRRSAETGNSRASYILADVLLHLGRDEEAEPWTRQAAEKADTLPETIRPVAMRYYGDLLKERGQKTAAEPWFRRAAEAGDPHSMIQLGALLHARGQSDEAQRWFVRAAEKGDTDAMFELGLMFNQQGRLGECCTWYQRAAEAGDTRAMNNLALVLAPLGRPDEAEAWYRRAIEAGERHAITNLANLLHNRGDLAGAEKWFRAAADDGNPIGMNNLGAMNEIRGDLPQADHWYHRAADLGYAEAMTNLGRLFEMHNDPAGAQYWYRRAADGGNVPAMDNLARLLKKLGRQQEADQWRRWADARRAAPQ